MTTDIDPLICMFSDAAAVNAANPSTLIFQILLQIVLIFINAVFACAEIAVISINDAKLNKLASEGDKRAV